jgi:EmrB/QacA subfamily drug resistance transporter
MTQDPDKQIHEKKYGFLLVSALAAFIATLDASIVNVSLPTLSRTFSVPVDLVAWVVLSYACTITSTLRLAGRITVKMGYRFVYMVGFSLFTIGSLLCAFSGSIWELVLSRIVQGLGATFQMACGPALVTRVFPANERGKAMGLMGTVVGVGLMSGPPLGGFLVSTVGWQSIFLINIPIGIFGIIYAGRLLKMLKPDNPGTKIDLIGGIYQATGVIFLLLFLSKMSRPDWSPGTIYGMLAISLLSFVAFFWRETYTDEPLLGLEIFRHRQFSLAISVMTLAFICMSAGSVLIPFFLEEILHLVPKQVGVVLVTIPVCMMLIAPISGRISDAIGVRFLTTFGLALFVTGMFWVSQLNHTATRLDVVMRLIVVGIGLGIFHSPNSSALMSAVPKKVIGIASGLLAVARNLGISGGVAVSTAIFAYRKDLYLESMTSTDAFISSFSWVVVTFACMAILPTILSSFRKNRIGRYM